MGILNVTPDSFSDGGHHFLPQKAIESGLRMLEEGADILDIGGESTRPGAEPVTAEEELNRVGPVIKALSLAAPQAILSIDTYKAAVAREAVSMGASIINDVGGGQWDPEMKSVVAASYAGYVLMHSQGRPQTMQHAPHYEKVVEEVVEFLRNGIKSLHQVGILPERVAIDSGIGFGKTAAHNVELLGGAKRLQSVERPVVWGVSRKSFLSQVFRLEEGEKDFATAACLAALRMAEGAQVWRVHHVRGARCVADITDTLARG